MLPVLQLMAVYWHPLTLSQESLVHASLSLHVIGAFWQPELPSQESAVQAFESLQFTAEILQPEAALHTAVEHLLGATHGIGVKMHP
jgi:hypothetical protein